MNLNKLFEAQKEFRDRINYNDTDRLHKLALALLVEVGECANELPEVFKFWSKKRKNNYEKALMEYVDGLHFVLDIGLEIGFRVTEINSEKYGTISNHFLQVFWCITEFEGTQTKYDYEKLFNAYLGLGEMIGFTKEQIHAAYFAKNQINHARQDAGY